LYQGKFKRPYFAHRKGDSKNCQFGGFESEEHEEGKRFIYDLLRSMYNSDQVILEETLVNGQRADVLLNLKNRRFAFEIQFSEQDGNKWESRNEKYRNIDIVPIWILGYRKPIHEIIVSQGDREPAKIILGRTREYAIKKIRLVQELIDHFTGISYGKHDAWEIVEQYQAVHILSVSKGIAEFCLGYITQRSAIIWEGYTLPITQSSVFDQNQCRFIPEDEVSARKTAESKHLEQIEWKNRIHTIQDELRQKVLAYTKAERVEWLPVVLANEDVFCGYMNHGTYDILLLELALYLKIIRIKSFSEDTIEEFFLNWKFEWKEYRDLFLRGEIGDFFERLVKEGVLHYADGIWHVSGKLSSKDHIVSR
jgi:hypothetical protein